MDPRDRLNELHPEMIAQRRDVRPHPEPGGAPRHNRDYDFNGDPLPIGAIHPTGTVEQELIPSPVDRDSSTIHGIGYARRVGGRRRAKQRRSTVGRDQRHMV